MKRYYQYFVVVWMAVFVTTTCFAQQQSTRNLAQDIDQLIATYADYGKFNGAVLVAKEGEVIYKKGVGLANMEWNIPNEADTKFRLASVTKQFTAMLVVQLAAQNKIDLQAPITTYLTIKIQPNTS